MFQTIKSWGLVLTVCIVFGLTFVASLLVKKGSVSVSAESETVEFYNDYHGDILVVVVLRGAFQVGDRIYPLDTAEATIRKLIGTYRVRNYCVFGSDEAKLGDVVRVYGIGSLPGIARKQLSSTAVRSGTIMPSVVKIRPTDRFICGTSLGLDTFVAQWFFENANSEEIER